MIKYGAQAVLFGFLCGCSLAGAEAQESAAPQGSPPPPPLVSTESGVDVVCQSDVFFTWQKRAKQKVDERGRIMEEPPPAPAESYFTTAVSAGVAEPDVRSKLNAALAQQKAAALAHCRSQYDDLAGCISSRLKSRAADYNAMDFASRRVILSAIETDCVNNLGTCLGAENKPVRCYLNRPPDMKPPAPVEQKKEEKGGKKK